MLENINGVWHMGRAGFGANWKRHHSQPHWTQRKTAKQGLLFEGSL